MPWKWSQSKRTGSFSSGQRMKGRPGIMAEVNKTLSINEAQPWVYGAQTKGKGCAVFAVSRNCWIWEQQQQSCVIWEWVQWQLLYFYNSRIQCKSSFTTQMWSESSADSKVISHSRPILAVCSYCSDDSWRDSTSLGSWFQFTDSEPWQHQATKTEVAPRDDNKHNGWVCSWWCNHCPLRLKASYRPHQQ